MAYGWEGERVRLAPLDLDRHFENAVAWVNDPSVTENLLIGDVPMTRVAEREWFDRFMKPSDEDVVFAIETLEGVHLGFSGIHRIRWPVGRAITGSMIAPVGWRGKGLGTEASRLRARYAFEVLGLRMLTSETLGDNLPSRRMLEKTGYVEYGRLPGAHWKRGRFQDSVLLYLDRERWRSLQAGEVVESTPVEAP